MTRNDAVMPDLFDAIRSGHVEIIADGAVILHGFALDAATELLAAVDRITARAPFRRMTVPGGHTMSAAITNCGDSGWVSDRKGYRYDPHDPDTGKPWPVMPECFASFAALAAAQAGYDGFHPDACLINHYAPGARVSLHQDKNERDFSAPIVSVSLGLPATFLFGGALRADRPARLRLVHGDVAVWGGVSRLAFHGIAPVKDDHHPVTGRARINLTFRKAL